MQMKYADGNENIRHKHIKAKHKTFHPRPPPSLVDPQKGEKPEKSFLRELWDEAGEENGFNIVMSNLKFKHNKSGFHKILRSPSSPKKKKKWKISEARTRKTFAY